MNEWNVGDVTDFSKILKYKATFTEDISCWDVSSGTDFVSVLVLERWW